MPRNSDREDPFPPFWEAKRRYRDEPFAPFWKKERLLHRMMPQDAERIAENDVFLPKFSREKFRQRR